MCEIRQNILLVDCNNFFVACEELFNPALKGKPVCVLSNNDGCIVSRSNVAKNMGIPMGLPYFMAKRKFPTVIYLSGKIPKYSEISNRIMAKLKEFTPDVEIYSIDEAFLNVKGTEKLYKKSAEELAFLIRQTIINEIGIEVSIGSAPTKTLAKIASEIAKTNTRKGVITKFEGVFEINAYNLEEILSETPIEEVWGVGKNLHKFFRKHNLKTALELANSNEDFLKRNLGKKGIELKGELQGVLKSPVQAAYVPPKSILNSSSFKEFTTDAFFIKNELNRHLHHVCKKLRKEGLSCLSMSVMLRTKDFFVYREKISFDFPKNSEFELYKEMHALFDILYDEKIIYRSSGVAVFNLTPTADVQMNLFEGEEEKKKKKLSVAWDKIEQKFGYGAIKIGTKDQMPKQDGKKQKNVQNKLDEKKEG